MKKIIFTEEQKQYIINEYSFHRKSTGQLGEEFNCHSSTIKKRLEEWGYNTERGTHHFRYEDLTGQTFGELTVLGVNQQRYDEDVKKNNKPHRYWTCICSCGRIKDVESSHLKNGHTTSCGHIRSKGEQKITQILQDNQISFTCETSFKDLRGYGNGLLRYDFAILKNNKIYYLIEFHGKQHYQFEDNGWNTKEEFEIRQFNDNKKIEYCKNNSIPLIIIPYDYLDAMTIKDLLLETTIFRKV